MKSVRPVVQFEAVVLESEGQATYLWFDLHHIHGHTTFDQLTRCCQPGAATAQDYHSPICHLIHPFHVEMGVLAHHTIRFALVD